MITQIIAMLEYVDYWFAGARNYEHALLSRSLIVHMP